VTLTLDFLLQMTRRAFDPDTGRMHPAVLFDLFPTICAMALNDARRHCCRSYNC
jgi:hypothetical protein